MAYLSVLISLILITIVKCVPEPQLDLPKVQGLQNTGSGPEVLINSYTNDKSDVQTKSGTNYRYDRERSERYGPPYDQSDENDEYQVKERDNERYNSNYNNQNPSNDPNNVRFPQTNNANDFQNNRNPQLYPNVNPVQYPGLTPVQYPGQNPYLNNPQNGFDYNNNNNNQFDAEYQRRIRIETEKLKQLLNEIDKKSAEECTLNVAAQWNFETNVNEATQAEALAAQQRYADFQRSNWEQINKIDQGIIFDESIYREVKLISTIGTAALPPDQLDRYNRIINDMLAIYNSATICAYEQPFQCDLRLQPHLKDIMAKSRDWDELTWVWTEWRRKSGKNMRDLFEQMADLTNDAAKYNNFTNGDELWSFPYDSSNFRNEMESVWQEILPLYELLHAYVRRKLREFYGPDKINRNAPLPDHILGNMYGQSWNILDLTIPYPGRSYLDVTPAMRAQGYTPLVMYQIADEFYTSMNMTALPPDFWANSILQEPADRPILCQPSAWDFCNGRDYRIKMCTDVTHKDFITVHHELAHIQYFLNYRNKPKAFRDGANPGFHEAIGDAVSISITPKHLQSLGLIQKSVDDTAHDINFLFAMAMDKVVFLPFALALENWRYDIFSKKIRKDQYNCHWWLLREEYGGVKPPVLRSELDFDPGSKYHVPANVPYMKYFFGAVLQFQLHRAMCIASKEFNPSDPTSKPLNKCSIFRHPEAGDILKRLMEKGASQPWQQVLQEVIGEGRLDGSALREYFRPLEDWLRNENLRNQEFVGWTYDGDYCKNSIETANLQVYGGFYNAGSLISISTFVIILIILPLLKFVFSIRIL